MARTLVYYTPWCGDCRVAMRVLAEHRIEYDKININDDIEGQEKVRAINNGNKSVPTIIFPSGEVAVEPSAVELIAALASEGLLKTP